jgi:hypothetical protein
MEEHEKHKKITDNRRAYVTNKVYQRPWKSISTVTKYRR